MIFNKQEINTGRQMCVDLAKVFAIVFMVAVHTMMYGGGDFDSTLGFLVDWVFGSPLAAPVFMLCMGIGVTYSRRNDAASLCRRGWTLLWVSYLFNAVRAFAYPVVAWCTGDHALLEKFVYLFLIVDILQFAGMAFLLLALLRKLKSSVTTVLVVGLLLSVVGSFVRNVSTGILPVDVVLSLFVGVPTDMVYSAFPLLNWFIFVALGLCVGKLLRRCNDLDRLFAWVTPISAVVFIALTVWMIHGGYGMYNGTDEAYYYLTLSEALGVCLPACLMMLGISHFLGKLFKGKAVEMVQRTSADLNRIYLVHWVIVMTVVDILLCYLLGCQFSNLQLLLIALVILILSAWIARRKPVSNIKL